MVMSRRVCSVSRYNDLKLARVQISTRACVSCSGVGGLVHVKRKLLAHAAVGGAAVMMVRAHGSHTLASHAITACIE